MGLFDFVTEAGNKLFGGDGGDEVKTAAASAAAPEETRQAADRRRAAALVKFVEGFGFEVADLSVKVEGETATLKGKVASQELREKVVLAVGNVSGISRVDDRMTVESPEPEAAFYTVVRGDTLSKIAKEHYGNASKYMVIFEANRPLLEHPDKIYPGQVLRIPPAG
jgi:nucleoid-associated protein YgaU